MIHQHSIAGHWSGAFDEAAIRAWAEQLRRELVAPNVSLGLIFIAPPLFSQARQILEIVRVHARVPLLVGCSGASLIAAGHEHEADPGVALGRVSFRAPPTAR